MKCDVYNHELCWMQLCAHAALLTVLYLHPALPAPCYACAVPTRLSDSGAQLSQPWELMLNDTSLTANTHTETGIHFKCKHI